MEEKGHKTSKSKIISDSSIKEQKEDRFGHFTFVNWLFSRLESANEPLNIGLFGKWGVGKTGILQMFESEINRKYSEKFQYVYIDCWKLSPESLREQILISIDGKFGGKKEDEIKNRLYNITEKITESENNEKWNKTFSRIIKKSAPYVILAAIFIGVGITADKIFGNPFLIPVIGSGFLIPIILELTKKIAENSKSISNSIKQVIPPIQSPIEFERLYKEILKQKKKDEKLIVAFDNLDRCEGNLVIDMISMIKSFMEHNDVIFIIPCDNEAIVEHLQNIRHFEPKNAREFLRKFFQASVEIPPFLEGDIIDYTDQLVKEYKIPANEGVKYVLSVASIDNPRKIKQFLNNFAANFALAEEREKEMLNPGTITNHSEFLAKILVLREQFPTFYSKILDDEDLLYYIEKKFQGNPVADANMGELNSLLENNKELENFLRLTRQIEVEEINPFIRFGQESRAKTLDQFSTITEGTRFCNLESIDKILNKESDLIKKSLAIDSIIYTVKDDIRKRRNEFGFNGMKVLLHLATTSNEDIQKKFIDTFAISISSTPTILSKIHYLDKKQVFSIIKKIDNRYRDTILEKYCEIFAKLSDFDFELFDLILENQNILSIYAKEKFGESMHELQGNSYVFEKLINERFANNNERLQLLKSKTFDSITGQIIENINPDNTRRINLCIKLLTTATPLLKDRFIDKLFSVLPKNPSQQVDKNIQFVVEKILLLNNEDLTENNSKKIIDVFGKFQDAAQGHDQKFIYFSPMLKQMNNLSQNEKDEFINRRVNVIFSWPPQFIDLMIDEIKKQKNEIFSNPKFMTAILIRTEQASTQKLIDFILEEAQKTKPNEVTSFIIKIFKNLKEPEMSQILSSSVKLTNLESDGNISKILLDATKKRAITERQQLMNALENTFEHCPTEIKKIILEVYLEMVKYVEPQKSQGIEHIKKNWHSIEPEEKINLLQDIIAYIISSGNLEPSKISPVNFVMLKQNDSYQEDMEKIIQYLITQTQKGMPEISKRLALETIIQLEKTYGFENDIFKLSTEIIEYGNDHEKNIANKILEKLKK